MNYLWGDGNGGEMAAEVVITGGEDGIRGWRWHRGGPACCHQAGWTDGGVAGGCLMQPPGEEMMEWPSEETLAWTHRRSFTLGVREDRYGQVGRLSGVDGWWRTQVAAVEGGFRSLSQSRSPPSFQSADRLKVSFATALSFLRGLLQRLRAL